MNETTPDPASRPRIAILGGGPTGLEAALVAADAGYPFTLYEAGDAVAAHVRDWGHVRLFSPWELNVSPRARRRLAAAGAEPPSEGCPTGAELVERALAPLAELPEIAPRLRLGTRIQAVSRQGTLKHEEIGTGVRGQRPFRLLLANGDGGESLETADAVLDCTGSYTVPNTLGDGGIPALGEGALAARGGLLVRRIPNVAEEAAEWAGKTVLLVGAGHSAQTAVRDLAELAENHPGTRVLWALRSTEPELRPFDDDALPERAHLMARAGELMAGSSPAVEVIPGVVVERVIVTGDEDGPPVHVTLRSLGSAGGEGTTVAVDRVLALTGSVGDHTLYRQLQVHECYATSGPMKLAAALLGESNGGDCLAQESHGAETLANPEPGFFILGAKSYGRNSTFLMRTGWQQVEEVFGLLGAGS